MSDRLVTARELAKHLDVTPSWVLRHWQAGELPGYRLGVTSHPVRFRISEVEAWLRTRRQGGGPDLKAVS